MEFFEILLRTVAGLVGLSLILGGFAGFWYGIYMIIVELNTADGVLIAFGSILALTIGTILGKFARGDYDLKEEDRSGFKK